CGHDKTTQRGCRAPDSLIHAVSGLYATCLQAGAVILIDALISGQRIASVQAASASYTAVFVITFIAVIFSVSISVVILAAAAFIIAESGIIRCGFLNGTPVQLQIYRLCPGACRNRLHYRHKYLKRYKSVIQCLRNQLEG